MSEASTWSDTDRATAAKLAAALHELVHRGTGGHVAITVQRQASSLCFKFLSPNRGDLEFQRQFPLSLTGSWAEQQQGEREMRALLEEALGGAGEFMRASDFLRLKVPLLRKQCNPHLFLVSHCSAAAEHGDVSYFRAVEEWVDGPGVALVDDRAHFLCALSYDRLRDAREPLGRHIFDTVAASYQEALLSKSERCRRPHASVEYEAKYAVKELHHEKLHSPLRNRFVLLTLRYACQCPADPAADVGEGDSSCCWVVDVPGGRRLLGETTSEAEVRETLEEAGISLTAEDRLVARVSCGNGSVFIVRTWHEFAE